ncbi:methylglyoxal synthase [Rothia nasimurium]|uniref:Methylglyoxal synthase n=1 Tax=Luteibacter anthropi TaxID=564369 RepID=A0A7X5UCS5_9GAMM|nr:methylglyoxal synthase [Luteibacter anthropi]NII07853.1 methylglyoxal synthase [Luteibacter anthropi]
MDTRLALVAHDARKERMLLLARDYIGLLRECRLCSTRTTGTLLRKVLGLDVECMASGPLGGDVQLASRVISGGLDMLILLRDTQCAHPHDADINALLRICDVWNVPCATNEVTARILLFHAQVTHGMFPTPL